MDLSPLPILDAAERYRGTFVDVDARRVVSADAFHLARTQLAAQLAQAGLQSGHRVVMAIGNGPQLIATLVAILSAGGSPLLVHAKTPVPELKRTALRFGARMILADDETAGDVQAAALDPFALSAGGWLELVGGRVDPATPGFDERYVDLPSVPLHPTSGTTGQPKVAVRPGFAAAEEARHYIETIGITADDVILAAPPMCHAYAYGMCVMVPLLSGAQVVSLRSFHAAGVWDALAGQRISVFPAVPAMLDVLMFGAGERLRGAFRTVLSAGSPLAERTALRYFDKSGVMVRPLYGTTETGGITVAPAGEQPLPAACVGPPMQGVAAEVRVEQEHKDAPPGVGKLFIRSSSMMAGYLGRDGVDTALVTNGWFCTGDLARLDDAGRIHLLGREAEVINVEGLKVIPAEVEEVIAEIAGVLEVKVYAGSRRLGGQFIKAAVVSERPLDVAAVRSHCEQNLVYYKRPERIFLLDKLPRSPAGKIVRDQLP